MDIDNRAGPTFSRLKSHIYGEDYKKPVPFYINVWLTTHSLKNTIPIRRKSMADYNEPVYMPFKFENFKINIEF